MSVLTKLFNREVDCCSPHKDCYEQKIDYDKDLNPIISYCKVDSSKIIEANGKASDWSLSVLLKAGINPSFPIHTSMNSRLEGIGILNGIVDDVDKFFAENTESVESEKTE